MRRDLAAPGLDTEKLSARRAGRASTRARVSRDVRVIFRRGRQRRGLPRGPPRQGLRVGGQPPAGGPPDHGGGAAAGAAGESGRGAGGGGGGGGSARPFADTAEETLLKHGVRTGAGGHQSGDDRGGVSTTSSTSLPEEAAEALLLMAEGLTPPEPVLAGEGGVSTDPYERTPTRGDASRWWRPTRRCSGHRRRVGGLDGLPAPRAAAPRGAGLQRPRPGGGLGGHGQNGGGAAPGGGASPAGASACCCARSRRTWPGRCGLEFAAARPRDAGGPGDGGGRSTPSASTRGRPVRGTRPRLADASVAAGPRREGGEGRNRGRRFSRGLRCTRRIAST